MKKSKWFEPHEYNFVLKFMPTKVITRDDLKCLMGTMDKKNIKDETKQLLRDRATMDLRTRLIVNLRSMLTELKDKHGVNVLEDGLSTAEYKALAELQLSNLPSECLITAHSLLNISERSSMLGAFNSAYDMVRHRNDARLET